MWHFRSLASMPEPPTAQDLNEVFDRECHLCHATQELVPDPNFDFLFLCRTCLTHWEDHLRQIEERDEPPPSVE